jgi:hypothetical protein
MVFLIIRNPTVITFYDNIGEEVHIDVTAIQIVTKPIVPFTKRIVPAPIIVREVINSYKSVFKVLKDCINFVNFT